MTRPIHVFTSTGAAYDACQCDENIKTGDTLLIAEERVVGIAHTWPFAVTPECGALHTLAPGATPQDVDVDEQAAYDAVALAIREGFMDDRRNHQDAIEEERRKPVKKFATTKEGHRIVAHCCAEDNSGIVFERDGKFVCRFSYPAGEDEAGNLVYEETHDTRAAATESLRFTCGYES